jgi:hypothetical protein
MYQRDVNHSHLIIILVGFVQVEAARRAYMIVSVRDFCSRRD